LVASLAAAKHAFTAVASTIIEAAPVVLFESVAGLSFECFHSFHNELLGVIHVITNYVLEDIIRQKSLCCFVQSGQSFLLSVTSFLSLIDADHVDSLYLRSGI